MTRWIGEYFYFCTFTPGENVVLRIKHNGIKPANPHSKVNISPISFHIVRYNPQRHIRVITII